MTLNMLKKFEAITMAVLATTCLLGCMAGKPTQQGAHENVQTSYLASPAIAEIRSASDPIATSHPMSAVNNADLKSAVTITESAKATTEAENVSETNLAPIEEDIVPATEATSIATEPTETNERDYTLEDLAEAVRSAISEADLTLPDGVNPYGNIWGDTDLASWGGCLRTRTYLVSDSDWTGYLNQHASAAFDELLDYYTVYNTATSRAGITTKENVERNSSMYAHLENDRYSIEFSFLRDNILYVDVCDKSSPEDEYGAKTIRIENEFALDGYCPAEATFEWNENWLDSEGRTHVQKIENQYFTIYFDYRFIRATEIIVNILEKNF